MSRLILAGAAALVAVSFVPQLPVLAQEPNVDATGAPIVVTAPRVRQIEQPRTGVIPEIVIEAQVSVSIEDLDLQTQAGRDALDERVKAAAEEACDAAQRAAGPSGVGDLGDTSDCTRQAVNNAQTQVHDAVVRAGG